MNLLTACQYLVEVGVVFHIQINFPHIIRYKTREPPTIMSVVRHLSKFNCISYELHRY
jgi:hypothetical protein